MNKTEKEEATLKALNEVLGWADADEWVDNLNGVLDFVIMCLGTYGECIGNGIYTIRSMAVLFGNLEKIDRQYEKEI